MVLGAMDDGTSAACYFVSSQAISPTCAPPPPTDTLPLKKAESKKKSTVTYKAFPEVKTPNNNTSSKATSSAAPSWTWETPPPFGSTGSNHSVDWSVWSMGSNAPGAPDDGY
eukprot:2368326-Prorocentrum_lima.AAC.1